MMLWLWLSTAFASDPSALRLLHGDAPFALDVGTQGVSAAADIGPLVAVTVDPGAWVGAAVGTHAVLAGPPTGWGIDGTLAAGVAVLLATPGAALTGTASVRGGQRGPHILATAGLTAPAAIRIDWPTEAVIPLDLELFLGGRLGPTWLGLRGYAGAALVPGQPPALRQGLSAWLKLSRP